MKNTKKYFRIGLIVPILLTFLWASCVSASTTTYPISLATYLGGDDYEESRDIALDAYGNIYIVGGTKSGLPGTKFAFPTTPGVVQPVHNQDANPDGQENLDFFITKLDPNGRVIWSTFLGGPCYDRAYAVEVDPNGNVYVAGRAGCSFPFISPNAFQPNFMGGSVNYYGRQDGLVAKLSPDGKKVLWASYFGTDAANFIRDMDIDTSGNVFVIGGVANGSAVSAGIADGLNRGLKKTPLGGDDLILAKIRSDGQQVLWATRLGGSQDEVPTGSVRVGSDNTVFAQTTTVSPDAETKNAFQPNHGGGNDAYLVRLSGDGKQLLFATYLGGSDSDYTANCHNLWLDAQDNPILAGATHSKDFPVTPNAYQSFNRGANSGNYSADGDLFVSKLSKNGKNLLGSTFIGGSLGDVEAEGITVDLFGDIIISANSYSLDFPTTTGPGKDPTSEKDNVLVIFNSDLSSLIYSSYMGGAGLRTLDSRGPAIVGSGETESPNWQTVNPVQPYRGNGDVSLVRLAINSDTFPKVYLPTVQRRK